MQRGGCHPKDGCQDGDAFAGAKFAYLAANVLKLPTAKETAARRVEKAALYASHPISGDAWRTRQSFSPSSSGATGLSMSRPDQAPNMETS